MFEVYAKDVTINGVPYRVKPLSGRHLPKLFRIIKQLPKQEELSDTATKEEKEAQSQAFMNGLEEETIQLIHDLALETFKKSYPNEDANKLDEFVSQNLFKVFPVLIEVNLNNKE